VQRQDWGTLGRRANCRLGVSVNAVTEHASGPLDWRLFPERWTMPRCHSTRGLPAAQAGAPSAQVAAGVGQAGGAGRLGLRPPVLVADSGDGKGGFRAGLDARQLPSGVEVRSDTGAYPELARPTVAPHKGRGRRPRPRDRDQPCSLPQLAFKLVSRPGWS
jgi:SRSO17 transposase